MNILMLFVGLYRWNVATFNDVCERRSLGGCNDTENRSNFIEHLLAHVRNFMYERFHTCQVS
jgi:hypothetical protein